MEQVEEEEDPIFNGFVISISGLHQNNLRVQIQSLVKRFGGIYMGTLEDKKTTHLITDQPVGQKYEAAQQWGIPVLHPDWILKSVQERKILPMNDYYIIQQEVTKPFKNTNGGAVMNDTLTKRLELLSILDYEPPFVLTDCNIYFTGVKDAKQLILLTKIVMICGGVYYEEFGPNVTHVIVIDFSKISSYLDFIRNENRDVPILKLEWLLKCAENKTRFDSNLQEYQLSAANHSINNSSLKTMNTSSASKKFTLYGKLVCVSMYEHAERDLVRKATEIHGGTFTEQLKRNVDILICKNEESEKYKKAKEWGIEIHTLDWLLSQTSIISKNSHST